METVGRATVHPVLGFLAVFTRLHGSCPRSELFSYAADAKGESE